MPTKRKKKLSIEHPLPPEELHEDYVPAPVRQSESPKKSFITRYRLLLPLVLLILLAGLFLTNKGLVVAAIVNGKPIFRWDLNRVLVSHYGQQTLENMINEQLINDAAKSAGVTVSQADIDAKEKELLKTLGDNVKLEDLLKYQGMTKKDFDDQIRLQLTVQKVLGKDITVTSEEITNYIATSGAQLTATDPATLKEEARAAILDKKIGEKIQPWFTALKQKANVIKFL